MEKKSSSISVSESEFIDLLQAARQGDREAILKLIQFFEKDITHLVRFIRLPKEDAQQSIITEMIELFKNKNLEEQ
jgi:hypothetical protein